MKIYSRLAKTEEKKNKQKAIIYIVLTVLGLILIAVIGIPTIVRLTGFVFDIKDSGQPIETEDITPPPPPRLNNLPEYTNKERLEIIGSSEPGSTAILFLNGDRNEVLVNGEGEFNYTYSLDNGDNSISVQSKDASGNESAKSDDYIVVYDNEPPEIEIKSPKDGDEFGGLNERQVTIDGVTESDAKITINDRFVAVDTDGTFAFASTLNEGDNPFKIKVEDKAGNVTETALTLKYSE